MKVVNNSSDGASRRSWPSWVRMLLAVLVLIPVVSQAATITDVEFSARQDGRFEIKLQFDGRPPDPKGYTIERPARIALDFPGAASALKQKRFPLSYDNATSAVLLEGRDRTRLVLNLVDLVPYSTYVVGNAVVIDVGGSAGKNYLKQTERPVVAANTGQPAAAGNRITDLDFRRGADGEGRLIVSLDNPRADIDVFVEGQRIKARFKGVTLPPNLSRRFDVSDFATPVEVVDASGDRSGTLLSLKAEGEYDYLAYQTDTEYVISVKPLSREEAEVRRKEFAYVGEKLSLNFQDIEVRAVLQLIADFTELNLVASDTVGGNITLRLQNVPWDQALDLVLKTKGLDKRLVGNVLMVAPAAEIAERERQQIESQKQVQELAPLQTEYIRIRYADAGELFKLFDTSRGEDKDGSSTGSLLSSRGRVIVDERTNSLLVTETAEKLEEFRRLVQLIDVPVRQVQIEARIVRANTGFDEALGVQWSSAYSDDDVDQGTLTNTMITDLGVGGAAGRFLIGFLDDNVSLSMELSALETQGRGEVVSQPKIITGDKEAATIKSGSEIPFPESAANGETAISFKEAVLKLEVTPTITPDDRVMMELIINQDSIGELAVASQGVQIPTINTTELSTRVLVRNGETIVLGGVFAMSEVEAVTKVPLLGDIPYLGRMFRNTVTSSEKQETLIFVTPRILADSLID